MESSEDSLEDVSIEASIMNHSLENESSDTDNTIVHVRMKLICVVLNRDLY